MTHGRKASAGGLCALALVLIGCGAAHAAPRVGLYMNEATEVLSLKWDHGPANLEAQLNQLGFDVERDLSGQPGSVDAYVIPVQNGNSFYSAAEDMDAIAQYVEEGGLVVILDSLNGRGEALTTFVSRALHYQGNWAVCKEFGNNLRASYGEPALSAHATGFLSGQTGIAWPTKLEDAAITTVHTFCTHEDTSAFIKPLYTILGDEMKTVVQAFGKVGVKGAIVWVGYSWREGVKDEWGALLNKLITDFSNELYTAPSFATGTLQPFGIQSVVDTTGASLEHVVEAVSEAAHEASVVVKRMLLGGTYPSPPSPVPAPTPAPVPSPECQDAECVQAEPRSVKRIQSYRQRFRRPNLPSVFANAIANDVAVDPAAFLLFYTEWLASVRALLNLRDIQGPYIVRVRVGGRVYTFIASVLTPVSRRMALEEAEQVWDRRQLLDLSVDERVCPTDMLLLGSRPATVPEVEQLFSITPEAIVSVLEVVEEPAGRQLLQDDDADGVDLDFDIVFFDEATSPPPTPPGVDALPNRPPNPPPMPPISVLDAVFRSNSTELSPSPAPVPSPSSSPSPSPSPSATPSPSPVSSPSPTPSPFKDVKVAPFMRMPAMGSVGPTRDLVWNFDSDFASELRDRRALQLVDPNKVNCTFRSATSCQNCLKAWKAWPPVGSSQKGAKPRPSNNNWGYDKSVVVIPLYFSDPVQLSDIYIKQIKAPGLRKVQLLSWPLDPLDEWFDINKYVRDTVYDSDDDSIPCQSELHVTIPKSISGINLAVPATGNRNNLPVKLKKKAVGGILLTVRKPKRALGSTWIETVKFDGRALYPSRDLYGPYAPASAPTEDPKGGRRPRRRPAKKAAAN